MHVLKRAARRAGVSRARVASARMCCERHLFARVADRQQPRSRILCYHSVGTPSWGVNDVSPRDFRRQLESAMEQHYRFVPADVVAAEPTSEAKRLAITFDDGLASSVENGGPILAEMGIPWTLFVVTDWSDGKHSFGEGTIGGWETVEKAMKYGATIGSHSVTHPRFTRIGAEAAAEELSRSRETIAARVGVTPTSFAVPLGTSRDWSADLQRAARAAGYRYVYAQSEDRRTVGTIPRSFVGRFDTPKVFRGVLEGRFDRWEEWV